MVCIYCSSETKVTNSRLKRKTNQVWRRRQCLVCGGTFTTEEAAVTVNSLLFDKNGRSEPFSREKLLISVYESLKHRKTVISDATALTDTIWSRLHPLIANASLQRDDVAQQTADVLKRFDKAAATAYIAFHPVEKS